MKKSLLKFLTFTLVIILSGCAATYKPINPPILNYNVQDSQDGIGLAYRHDVLREKGNKKYANKADKNGIRLIALKITNNTDSVINIGRDVAFSSGQNQIFPMEPLVIKESIKQSVASYLPYLLLTLLTLHVQDGQDVKTYPIGLILGPAITLGNMAVAGSSNENLLNELYDYNILSRDIQKGETVYGIIGVRDLGYVPISIKMIN